MAPIDPALVNTPKSRIKKVTVLHDGIATGTEFSIAKLDLHNGKSELGIRHDTNYWNDNGIDRGYPTVRGYPTWFILPPNIQGVLSALSSVIANDPSLLDI